MRYKIQDGSKIFKKKRGAFCLPLAKDFFQNDSFLFFAFFVIDASIRCRKFPRLFGRNANKNFEKPNLHFNHAFVFRSSFDSVKPFGHLFVKIHFQKENHFHGLLHF